MLGKSMWGILLLGAAACGDGGNGSEQESGNAQAAIGACEDYCEANLASDCPLYDTRKECNQGECSDIAQAPAACQDANEAWYDCLNAMDDACVDLGCEAEENALEEDCY